MKNKWHIETRLIADLIPHPKNPRQFTEKGMKDLGRSIDAFGLAEPIVINTDGLIIGGHARYKILLQRNETECDCYVPERQLTDKEVEELNIRLNANTAGIWDTERLANEWELPELLDWGLDLPEFRNLEAQEDDYVIPDEIVTDIKRGDIFQIGEHRLMNGDSVNAEDVGRLMNGEKADMCFFDPPYGNLIITNKKGEVGKSNFAKTKQYHKYANEGNFDFFPCWEIIKDWKCKKLIWGGNYFPYLPIMTSWIIWDKRAGKHSWYSDCEMAWTNFGIPARIYTYIWQGMIREGNDGERLHPTQKPIGLINKIITDNMNGNLILDLFLGSGSTMVAAHQLNRRCFGMEISPQYCQVIIDRMKKAFPDIEIKQIN